jgi:6-phosphogluconolactonase (cycloisomerase 2 family)
MFVYVGSRTTKERNARGRGINVYRMNTESGCWSHVQLVGDLANPSFLATDRSRRFLYSVHGDFSEISAFAIDAGTGRLTFINRQSTCGKNPVHLAIDNTNRFAMVANYATGTLAVLPRNPDGSLGPVAQLVELPGTPGPHKVQQASSHPHHLPFDPAGRFILVPDKGLDRIFIFAFDASTGKLAPAEMPFVTSREGSAPRHVAFHPSAPYAYVINELNSTITAYRYTAERGRLEPVQIIPSLPDTFFGENTGAEIAVAPSGSFLYASNRGHDSIGVFAIDQGSGRITPVGWESTQGDGPRFFALAPSGHFLYAANENSDTIFPFRVDSATGKLSPAGGVIATGSPVCIIFSANEYRGIDFHA